MLFLWREQNERKIVGALSVSRFVEFGSMKTFRLSA